MKLLYYASYILTTPFYAAAQVLGLAGYLANSIGDWIHDRTTCKLWLALHYRELKNVASQRPSGVPDSTSKDANLEGSLH